METGTTTEPVVTSAMQLTTAQLQPILDSITGNMDVLLPIGVTIMGVMVAVSLIPRIVYKFL